MTRFTLEDVVDKYIVDGHADPKFTLLTAVADALAGSVIRATRRKECPFCGRSFRSRVRLKAHLRNNGRCGIMYAGVVDYVISRYCRLKGRVRRGSRYRLELPGKPALRFRSTVELGEYVREHPEVLDEV